MFPSSPNSGAMRRIARITLSTCSQRSIPNSCAPAAISSRFAPAAKARSFHFFLTEEEVRSYREREGRTRATAVISPVTSSQAYRAFSINVVRGMPVWSAWERMARTISSGTPCSRRMGAPAMGCSSRRRVGFPVKIVEQSYNTP